MSQNTNDRYALANKHYQKAFLELKGMLQDSIKPSFKRAVFITENAYQNDTLSYDRFNNKISLMADLCLKIAKQGDLYYDDIDKEEVRKYWSVFMLMTDSMKFLIDSTRTFTTIPYRYDFDDFQGEKDWRKMFVTKLLDTNIGNCHSLPFLYKILSEEIGANAYLSMAPSHTYIKQWTRKTGWFNTELTSGYFPMDAWIMASGYIHLSAVQNRIYMDTLSQKQSIAVCLIDLAKGYERKFPDQNLQFILRCAELSLVYYPQYTNALLLKAETMKKGFEQMMRKYHATYPSDIFKEPEAKKLFDEMEQLYFHIHQLGYRAMPKEMYISWLADLKREREKYSNKEIIRNFNATEKR